MVTTSQIVTASTATVLVGVVGYAAWFDYKRRNDADFRKRLARENRKLAKVAQAHENQARESDLNRLRAAVRSIVNDPAANNLSMQESEQYFLENVSMGEGLAGRGPEHYVDAAISFFRALKVYPAPHELIQIYQRTLPPRVFEYIMQCFVTSREMATPNQPSGNAILEEIDDAAPRSGQSSPHSGTSAQYVHV